MLEEGPTAIYAPGIMWYSRIGTLHRHCFPHDVA